ncbi:hypothetical protein JL722_9540 [Aureococcus anophagefferens]|nr:hypothetical protein JL722_9540 [Aureococcus anophagefferens]
MAAGAEPSLQILGREDVAPIDLAPAPEDDAHMLLLKRAAGFGEVDLAVGPLDAPRLGEALAAHLPDAGWAFERTFYGYKMWKGDRWPFVDLLTMEFDEASGNVRYAEAAAREAWPNEWWAVDELRVARTPVWDHRRDRWHDDAKRGHAAESVELKAADRVPLGHRSLDDGGAEYAPPPDDGARPRRPSAAPSTPR